MGDAQVKWCVQATSAWSILTVYQVSSLHHRSKPPVAALLPQIWLKPPFHAHVSHADPPLCARSISSSHIWEPCMPSLDPPHVINDMYSWMWLWCLRQNATAHPAYADKCSRFSLPERLRRARHAHACSSMPWHAFDESMVLEMRVKIENYWYQNNYAATARVSSIPPGLLARLAQPAGWIKPVVHASLLARFFAAWA